MKEIIDIAIIGAGPAGISAAIYAKRKNKKVNVFYSGNSQIEETNRIENYYGFADGIDGKKLYQNGLNQAQNLEIGLLNEEVISVIKNTDNSFKIKTDKNEYLSKTVILASGTKNYNPNILDLENFIGKGISYCAICDGFFYRGKNVCVIGSGEYALSEANDLKNVAQNVKILTNGEKINFNSNFEVITKKIKKVKGNSKLEEIIFEDNEALKLDGLFIAIGKAGGIDFAKKVGIMTKGNFIVVDENMATSVEGIFACGNITGGLFQVNKSAYEGAIART